MSSNEIWYNEEGDYWVGSVSGRRNKNTLGKNDPHIPNKNEAKLLRKLMSETGMSEDGIRAIKKYRVMLSEAQKEGATKLSYWQKEEKKEKYMMKRATRITGLAKEHPKTIEVFKKIEKGNSFFDDGKDWY